jgi:hypothetical protein
LRIAARYSHLNGYEWLLVHERAVWDDIANTITSIDANQYKTKVSEEKTMKGKLLYSPIAINEAFTDIFRSRSWRESRTSYWVTDDYDLIRKTIALSPGEQNKIIQQSRKRPIFSYNQTDFVKRRVAVEVQFGKYSFIAYDLFVKHLAFFVGDKIDVGVEILPMKKCRSKCPLA